MANLLQLCIKDQCGDVALTKENLLELLGYEELIWIKEDTEGTVAYSILAKQIETETFSTVLYTDGTFIINESSYMRETNIADHGAVVAEYDPLDETHDYVFASASDQLWANKRTQIKHVEFGNVAPTVMNFWFRDCPVEDVNFDGLDTSKLTQLRSAFAGTKLTSLVLPSMPKLESIQYICRGTETLTTAVFASVGSNVIKNMTDAFQGCYGLLTVDLSGFTGVITDCERTFANISGDDKGDMKVTTIYSNPALDFSQAPNSSNMFRTCTSIVGGNGTTYDSSKINKAYARIDAQGTPGYFTEV